MRQYIVFYYAERNDECVDLEKEIEADSLEEALIIFKDTTLLYKRVTGINEIPLKS